MSSVRFVVRLLLPICITAVNPGLRLRVTEDGLNYANKVAVQSFVEEITNTRLEDITGKVGFVQYSLTNLIVKDLKQPKSTIVLASESDLEWRATDIGLEVDGTYKYKFNFLQGGNDFTVTMSDTFFSIGLHIGIDANGKPTIKTNDCKSTIGPLKIKFHGKRAWIYNLFSGVASFFVSRHLQSKVCEKVQDVINRRAEGALCSMKLQIPLGEYLTLDYRLLNAPTVTSEYLEGDLKGEVYWTQNKTEAPFAAPQMASIVDNKKMVYLTLSNYIFNTMTYQAHVHNILAYNLTVHNMRGNKDILNTTCVDTCIGNLIPQIGQAYPNSHVEMYMKSTDPPFTIISEKAIGVLGSWNITLFARKPDNTLHFLFGFFAVVTTSIKVKMTTEFLYFKLEDMKALTNVTSSAIGVINNVEFQQLADEAIKEVIEPTINDYLKDEGLPLPTTDNLQFKDSDIKLLQDTILIETNVKFIPNPSKKRKSNVLKYLPFPFIRGDLFNDDIQG